VGGAACAMPSTDGKSMSAMVSPATLMSDMSTAGAQPENSGSRSGRHSPCDGQRLPGDCSTAAACNSQVVPAEAQHAVGAITAGCDHATLAVLAPVSRATSPEPPPPRA
jgi:hypothetical protein